MDSEHHDSAEQNEGGSQSGLATYVGLGVVALVMAAGAFFGLRGFFGTESAVRSAVPAPTVAAAPTITAPPTSLPAATTTSTLPPRVFEPGPCVFEVSPDIAVECGFFPVPENRADPESENLRLAVMTIAGSQGSAAHPDPIVYLDGGPGGPGINPVDLHAWARLASATQRDVVLFSQRGTFFSEPNLACEDASFLVVDVVVECRRQLVSEGRDLGAYTSAASAEDLAELRRALGYDEWNLLGISYGSRLALTTMRDHPEGIRSVIVEGVYPLQVDIYGESADIDLAVLGRLFVRCAEDLVCAEHHPDLERRLESVVATLSRKPVVVDLVLATGEQYPQIVDGTVFLYRLVQLLGNRHTAVEVPAIITAAAAGDYERLFEATSPSLLTEVPIDEGSVEVRFSRGMSLSVQCGEEAPFSVVLIGEGIVERVLVQVALLELDLCEIWDVPRSDDVENEAVHSDISTLLLNGGLDNVTPLEWALHASLTLPSSFYFTFPGDGHGFSIYSNCAVAMMTAFLDDPRSEPDASCIENAPPPVFAET